MTNRDGQLTEWESKASNRDSTSVAEDVNGFKQGSRGKNASRALIMTRDKAPKIGLPSSRQGGAYTTDEIDLWQEVLRRRGEKQHISVHTNTESGHVQVLERDHNGNVVQTLDNFDLADFKTMKQAIYEAFKE